MPAGPSLGACGSLTRNIKKPAACSLPETASHLVTSRLLSGKGRFCARPSDPNTACPTRLRGGGLGDGARSKRPDDSRRMTYLGDAASPSHVKDSSSDGSKGNVQDAKHLSGALPEHGEHQV